VRQLNAGDAALPVNEGRDPAQHVDLRVLPQTQILRADAPARFHRCRLGEDEAGPAHGAAAQMHEDANRWRSRRRSSTGTSAIRRYGSSA
jgi:hypothetical protein